MQHPIPTLFILFLCVLGQASTLPSSDSATALVEKAVEYYRDKSSFAQVEMRVHRTGWERKLALDLLTKGKDQALVKVTGPAKDKGTCTLKSGKDLWVFSPKINKAVKIPPSMMEQAWMGSDFSNRDLSSLDDLAREYSHRLLSSETFQGKIVHTVVCLPHEEAAITWSKVVLKIRQDNIILEQDFYDDDGKLAKSLKVSEVKRMGGKLYPQVWTMTNHSEPGSYTDLFYRKIEFNLPVADTKFQVSRLGS